MLQSRNHATGFHGHSIETRTTEAESPDKSGNRDGRPLRPLQPPSIRFRTKRVGEAEQVWPQPLCRDQADGGRSPVSPQMGDDCTCRFGRPIESSATVAAWCHSAGAHPSPRSGRRRAIASQPQMSDVRSPVHEPAPATASLAMAVMARTAIRVAVGDGMPAVASISFDCPRLIPLAAIGPPAGDRQSACRSSEIV
jgi:hypothetical protein